MPERALELLIGALRLGVATGLVLATAWRWAPTLAPGRRSASERLLATGLGAGLLVSWLVAALGFAGILWPSALVIAALALYGVTRALAPRGEERIRVLPRGRRARPFLWPLLLAAPAVGLDALTHLPVPPTAWDALTYHLYLPARWLQEGRIFQIPTVFGDNAAGFAPQNGALLNAWQLGLLGGDALANWWQVLPAALLALALYRTGVSWGVGRESAALVAAVGFWVAPLREWTYVAMVDLLMVSSWFLAVHWMLAWLGARRQTTLLACGLATGFAAGTKTIGLPLVAAHTLVLGVLLLAQRSTRQLLGFGVAALAAGGWWYLRNFWLYGNPLFPLELRLGPLRLAGAYDFAATRGQFHVADPLELAGVLLHNWGAAACLLTALGVVGLAWGIGRRRLAPACSLTLGLAITWAGFFFFRLPHNTETRFFLPVLVLGLPGCMLLLDRVRHHSRPLARGLTVATVVAITAADTPQRSWRAAFSGLTEAGADPVFWVAAGALACAAVVGALLLRHRIARIGAALLAGAALAGALAMAQLASERSRDVFYSRARFRAWAPAFRVVHEARSFRQLRIAYTGFNLPYALMGSGFEHRVVYCNTQGRADDGFYEFWRRAPGPHPTHKPGLYRGDDDYRTWLEHLRAERIDAVVITTMTRAEGAYIRSTPEGFPIGRVWARRNPERFEEIASSPSFEIYRLRRK
jgi:hypothetical protein